MYQKQLCPVAADSVRDHGPLRHNHNHVYTTQKHTIRFGEVRNLVASAEGELTLLRLGGILAYSPPVSTHFVEQQHRVLAYFILLAGVIWPNIVLSSRIAVYPVSESSLLSVAVPKWSFPFDLASWLSLAAEVGAPLGAVEVEECDEGGGDGAEETEVAWPYMRR